MPNEDQQWENRHWSLSEMDHKLLINKAIDQSADALGIVFAIHGSASKQQLKTIQLNIQDVNSIQKYHRIERYLTALNAVDSVNPLQIDGQSVVFEVALRSRENDFLNLIKNDAELLKVEPQKIAPQEGEQEKVVPQEIEAQKILDNEVSPDLQNSTTETLNTTPVTHQPDPVTVYYYRLLK